MEKLFRKKAAPAKKLTKQEYKSIWIEFLKVNDDFKKMYGFGKKDIKRMGQKKFIDAMGWATIHDVHKFRTDKVHIAICPNCRTEFGVYELSVGICDKCAPKFNMKRFFELVSGEADKSAENAVAIMGLFFSDEEFRNNFLIYSSDEVIKKAFKENLYGRYTAKMTLELVSLAINKEGDGQEGLDMFKELIKLNVIDMAPKAKKEFASDYYGNMTYGLDDSKDWKNGLLKHITEMTESTKEKRKD